MNATLLKLGAAAQNSMDGLRFLLMRERAFRQEALLLLVALPIACFVGGTWRAFLLLIGSILFLMMVEALNTALEKACDAITADYSPAVKIAKDCGSAAVLIASLLCALVWTGTLLDRLLA
ncbi:diacylglycerol kinase [Camelimonas sp. ID_303_24]